MLDGATVPRPPSWKGPTMPIAISEEHEALGSTVRRWLDAHCPPAVPRALLDVEEETLQPVWKELASQGWLGIHVPEPWGGQGHGLFELAVVLEEAGTGPAPGAAPCHRGRLRRRHRSRDQRPGGRPAATAGRRERRRRGLPRTVLAPHRAATRRRLDRGVGNASTGAGGLHRIGGPGPGSGR